MKRSRGLMVLVLVLVAGLSLGFSQTVEIPNLEATILLDYETMEFIPGFTSKLLSYKDLDLRVGYAVGNKSIACLSIELEDLEKLGPEIHYGWINSLMVSFGIWAGYDFQNEDVMWGLAGVVVEVQF